MTLHDAIKKVLEDAKGPLPPKEIADEINSKNLYEFVIFALSVVFF